MPLLLLASLVWAFSFGLIGKFLPTSEAPSAFVAAARLLAALLVFLPFIAREALTGRTRLMLAFLGALQFGVVYVTYLQAFATLRPHEVALLTVFTPLLVWIGGDLLEGRLRWRHPLAALLAAAGAALVLLGRPWESERWTGVLLMQISNAAFAAGQLGFRALRQRAVFKDDAGAYGWMLAGACVLTVPWALMQTGGSLPSLTATQWSVIAYLGVVATGLGFFWWNKGATRVGVGKLAAANNAKIPLGVLVSLIFFSSGADWTSALCGLAVIAGATWLADAPSSTSRVRG